MNADEVKASYRNALQDRVSIRRFSGSGLTRSSSDTEIRARIVAYQPQELVGAVTQGDQRVIVYADDALALLPITKNDKLVVRGKELAILAVDGNTRRVGETLIALELQVRG